MLYLREALRCQDYPLQALLVKLVRRSARCSPTERRAYRDAVVLVGHILVNDVVGETGEGRAASVEVGLHFVGGGVLLESVEDFGGLLSRQHSALGVQLAKRSCSTLRTRRCQHPFNLHRGSQSAGAS